MSIGKKIKILNTFLFITVIFLILTIFFTFKNQIELNESYENRHESNLRANELRQSSNDLTRLARTYVVTGEKKYEDQYWDILAVRGGKKARKDGTTISLNKIMKELGFTKEEFGKLKEAGKNSNSLVTTETIAMNAVKGLYDNGSGKYIKKGSVDKVMARRIMFDTKYHEDKQIIVNPIVEFESMLQGRTNQVASGYKLKGNILLSIITMLSITLAFLIFFMIKNIKSVLSNMVMEIDESTDETDSLSKSIVEVSESVATATQEQASSLQETASSLEEISSMVQRNVDNAKNSADKATESYDVAQEGKGAIARMVQSMNDIKDSNADIVNAVEESNKEVSEIVNVINEISEKTKVINDIVFQTKLLSFNASVESARAGEHGKGFSVVAEEVGNLAQVSGKAANEISELLASSIGKVNDVVKKTEGKISGLMEDGNKRIDSGLSSANECDSIMNQVVENVDEVKSLMGSISSAAQDQSEGIETIKLAIGEIDRGVHDNSISAQKSKEFSSDLNVNANKLKSLVLDLKKQVLDSDKSA